MPITNTIILLLSTILIGGLIWIAIDIVDKTPDGLYVENGKKPDTCLNGFEYFSYYKGASLYLTPEGNPVKCKEQ